MLSYSAMEPSLEEMKRVLAEYEKAMGRLGEKGHEARVRHLEAMREKFPDHWMFQQEGTSCTKHNGI